MKNRNNLRKNNVSRTCNMIFGKVLVKSHCQSGQWIKLYNHLCCILNSLIWEHLFNSEHNRLVHCFGSHFVHSGKANVAPYSNTLVSGITT